MAPERDIYKKVGEVESRARQEQVLTDGQKLKIDLKERRVLFFFYVFSSEDTAVEYRRRSEPHNGEDVRIY